MVAHLKNTLCIDLATIQLTICQLCSCLLYCFNPETRDLTTPHPGHVQYVVSYLAIHSPHKLP